MILSNEEKENRLTSDDNLLNRLAKRATRSNNALIVNPETLGRKPDVPNIPPIIKDIVATAALAGDSTNKELGNAFGMSAQTVSDARNGRVGAREDAALKARLDENLGKIRDTAIERLMSSLGLLDDEKLTNCKARDLSSISANLSRVIEKSMPKTDTNPFAGVQVIVYSPRMKSMSDYDVIDVETQRI